MPKVWQLYLASDRWHASLPGGEVFEGQGATAALNVAEALGRLNATRRGWRRPRVAVWLSGALARPFVVGPVEGLRRWSEAEALARAQAPAATGLEGPCIVTLEDWPGSGAVVATAVEARVLDALTCAAREHRLKVTSIRPWWAGALETQSATAPMNVLREQDALTVLSGSPDRIEHAGTYAPPPPTDVEAQMLARLRLSRGLSEHEVTGMTWGTT